MKLALAGALLGALAGGAYAGESDPHAQHRGMKPSGTTRALAAYSIPNITMSDQHGATVNLPTLLETDQPVIVNFVFTTCTAICPMMSSIFYQVQRELGDDAERIRMISVSIDPEEDTVEALAEYAGRFRAGPQWSFLTGTLEDSIAVQKAFSAYRGDKMNHAPLTLVRKSAGSEWVRLDGFASANEIVDECRSALAMAEVK